MSSLHLGPRRFLLLCRITLAVLLANIATGAAVRLSDSGLGCPDWPTCSRQQLTPPLSLHPVVEFGNRVVVFLLVVACLATALASVLRRQARSDLRWLSGGLLLGVLGESVLGAVVVYTKLNAYVVVTHFMMGIALLTVGVVLTLRANHAAGRGTLQVSRGALLLTRLLLVMLVAVLAAGATTTGAGPHAGGKGAKRIPIGLEDMTRIHAEVVIASVLVLLALLWELWRTDAPRVNQDAAAHLAGGRRGPGIRRLRAVLHPPSCAAGRHPRVRRHDGLVDRALVPPRALLAPARGVVAARGGRTRARRRAAGTRPGCRRRGGAARLEPRHGAGAGVSEHPAVPAVSAVADRQAEIAPAEVESPAIDESQQTDRPWLVIVWNDPINLMSFVTFVFQKLFGYSKEKATKLMLDVHHKGRAVVSSGTRERAELDVYRLHEHGLWATMEQST